MMNGNDGTSSTRSRRSRPVLRDTAYRNFMDYLMSGQLRPGLLVSQRELCESTGSTLGTMREALKRLEAEGVITLIPQRGVMVREPDASEISEIYEARKIFEPYAARVYADKGDPQKIAEIEQQTREILNRNADTQAEAAKLMRERSLIDDLLHQTVIGVLNNRTLDGIFDKLRLPFQVSRISVQLRFTDSRPGLREHLVITEALQRRDGDAAAAAMAEHLDLSHRRTIGLDEPES